jgi:hypothetical protein
LQTWSRRPSTISTGEITRSGTRRQKAEPPSEAAEIRLELEQEERRAEALRLAVGAARRQIGELVASNRPSWRRQAMRELSRALQRYRDAISELEAGRAALSAEASLISWLDSGSSADAASDPLGGRTGIDASGRPAMSFSRTIEELRRDAEHLAEYPVARDDPVAEPRPELVWRG